jgi:hypothetical protein
MKRLFFTIGMAVCLVSLSAFASEKNLPDVLKAFYKTFQNAQNVSWTEVDDMLRIGFTSNGHQQYAYYSNEELIVVATQIQVEELPESLKAQLSEYKEYSITKVYELNNNNVKEYCAVLDNSSNHFVLKGKSKWKVFVEEKK